MFTFGTGNYNDSTAKLYTDCGIMTCHPLIGEDATAVFQHAFRLFGTLKLEYALRGTTVAENKIPASD